MYFTLAYILGEWGKAHILGMALSTFRQSPSQINKGNLENPPQTRPQAILV